MISETVIVKNKIGFHARPASLIVNKVNEFESEVTIRKGEQTATAKSMISLLTLRVKMDDEIVISAEGRDEQAVVQALIDLVNTRFGEE